MNLLEVVCAALVLSVCGAAAAGAWQGAVRQQEWAEQTRVACDGAEWAAERLFAGAGAASVFEELGWRCDLVESFDSDSWIIRASCGRATATLVIPWPGLAQQ
ncbi:MAG: hypothetical protein IRZ33_10410 [Alicyclobacillaceae bacterium]|nr:hypothetical protein [Alicyclobacillaceae bacterium]